MVAPTIDYFDTLKPPVKTGGFCVWKKVVINLGVGNAVPGVPSGAMRKHRARKAYRIAAFGGRNAEDGVPYRDSIEKPGYLSVSRSFLWTFYQVSHIRWKAFIISSSVS